MQVREYITIKIHHMNLQNDKERRMNYNDLTGKKAIVTGAAQGLSRAMAEGLMEAGVFTGGGEAGRTSEYHRKRRGRPAPL